MPHYTDFILSEDDLAVVKFVTDNNGVVEWNSKVLADIKGRIKALHLELQSWACCYCRRSLHGEFAMVVDVEHILPKCAFKDFIFLNVNLSASCKRCNMNVKRARWDFVYGLSVDDVKAHVGNSNAYEIIHPNLDTYEEHLRRVHIGIDSGALVKFLVGSATQKGKRTYDFFRLNELEVDLLDRAQGLAGVDDGEWGQKVRILLGEQPLQSADD